MEGLNLAYLQTPRPSFMAMSDQERREQRLREIMDELQSMIDCWAAGFPFAWKAVELVSRRHKHRLLPGHTR